MKQVLIVLLVLFSGGVISAQSLQEGGISSGGEDPTSRIYCEIPLQEEKTVLKFTLTASPQDPYGFAGDKTLLFYRQKGLDLGKQWQSLARVSLRLNPMSSFLELQIQGAGFLFHLSPASEVNDTGFVIYKGEVETAASFFKDIKSSNFTCYQ